MNKEGRYLKYIKIEKNECVENLRKKVKFDFKGKIEIIPKWKKTKQKKRKNI